MSEEGHSSTVEKGKRWLEDLAASGPKGFPGDLAASGPKYFAFLCIHFIRITRAERGHVICSFQIPIHVTDVEGNWHAGAIATMIDNVGSAAIMTVTGIVPVSVDFDISYFAPAKLDDEVEIDARTVDHMGKLTLVSVQVRRKRDRKMVASARQWMVSGLPSGVRSRL